MKFAKLVLIVLVVAIAAYFLVPRSGNYKNLPPTAQGDWIAYGDSLTAGFGAGDGADYPSLLGQQLGIKIHNYGIPGNTTQDGLARLDAALQLRPKVVLLCLGGNDGLRGLPLSQAMENLGTMIDSFHQAGSFVVLIGIRSPSLRDKNAEAFEQLAKDKQVFYISDILDDVIGRPSLMSDYIHPNDAGYRAIADRLGKELQPVLDKIR